MKDLVSPHFTTPRLQIRQLMQADAANLLSYHILPEVSKYQGWRPQRLTDAEDFIRESTHNPPDTPHTWLQFGMFLADDTLVGDVGIHFTHDLRQPEIGITLAPAYEGQGYATEATRAILNYLFCDLKKHRVTASVDPRNQRSIGLLERLGFRKEAHFIKSYWMDQDWCDDCIYAMLAEEWSAKSNP